MKKQFIEAEEAKQKVFEFVPKKFPIVISNVASGFISSQEGKASDFKLSELVAKQSGIAELQRREVESKVEAEALEKLKEIEEKAYKEAYQLGLIEGTEKAYTDYKEEFREKIESLDQLLKTFEGLKVELIEKNELQILQLLQLMASKIATDHVELNKDVIIKVIRKVIEDAQTEEDVIIKVSTEDYVFLESLRERQDKIVDFLKRVKIEPIDDIRSGGCILETTYGAIDSRLEQRLDKVWEAIESKMPRVNKDFFQKNETNDSSDEGKN
ncbi:MAG: hypothetical protein KDD58_05220 [Bdellovibrionales bacterium]|nr:hypothetical protein [Bdellovibrionales bacterium]